MMRMAILLLIVANIVLFLWLHAPQPPEPAVVTLPDPEIGRLILASEAEAEVQETADLSAVDPVAVDSTPDRELEAGPVQLAPAQTALVEDTPGPSPEQAATIGPSALTATISPLAEDALSTELALLNERLELVEILVDENPQTPATSTVAESAVPDAAVPDNQSVSEMKVSPSEAVGDEVPVPVVSAPSAADERSKADVEPTVSIATAKPTEGTEAVAAVEVPEDTPEQVTVATDAPIDQVAAAVADSTATVDSAGDEAPSPRPSVCARVGPLGDDAAESVIKALPLYVRLLSDVSEEYSEIDRYYVMIPALPSRAEGRQMLAALEAAGFSDTWLFPSGQYRNAISLGFFRYEPRAVRHADRVRSAGFDAIVEPRVSRREGRWLMLENVDGSAIELTLPLPETASVSPLACPGD